MTPSFVVASPLSSPDGEGEVRSWGIPPSSPFPEVALVLTWGLIGQLLCYLWERAQARGRLGDVPGSLPGGRVWVLTGYWDLNRKPLSKTKLLVTSVSLCLFKGSEKGVILLTLANGLQP